MSFLTQFTIVYSVYIPKGKTLLFSQLAQRNSQSNVVQRRMISVDNFFVFLRLLFFALLLLYVT